MKKTATERLSEAIISLLNRINDYCKKAADSPLRYGLCIVNLKHAPYRQATKEVLAELEKRAKDHFASLNVHGFYFQFWTPPALPVVEKVDKNAPLSADDYQLTYQLPQFNLEEEQRMLVRSLIFCPSDGEIYHWWDEWFEIQYEAIRYVPLIFQEIKERTIIRKISLSLAQAGVPVFETFANNYAIQTDYLGISDEEKKQIKKGEGSWNKYFPRIRGIFSSAKTLFDVYKICKEHVLKSRDLNDKSFLSSFVETVETSLIKMTDLPEDLKLDLLNNLRGISNNKHKSGYQAKRPVVCLSDIECGQALFLLLQKFLSNPKKYSVYGEMALYVWICQHAAFAGVVFKEVDILKMKVTDIDIEGLIINLNGIQLQITRGFSDILEAWIGKNERTNQRFLFPTLGYDNLEKNLKRISQEFFGKNGFVLPSDFLMKAHVIPFVRLSAKQRAEIDYQISLIEDSPYRIRNREIKKRILEAQSKMTD